MSASASSPSAAAAPTLPVKFVAQVAPVKEVTLHGTADLRYWQGALRAEQLTPVEREGQAQLFISATEARFGGIQFRECIVGVHVRSDLFPTTGDGSMFLLHAWNSLRWFAWIERTLFGTPYYPGRISLRVQGPRGLELREREHALISASQSNAPRRSSVPVEEEVWQGAIYLPRRTGRQQQLFIARLAGKTEHDEFQPGLDQFKLRASANCPAMARLLESNFTPRAWHIRQAAAHGKSKTYAADRFFGPR